MVYDLRLSYKPNTLHLNTKLNAEMDKISDITELKRICSQVRRDIIRMTHGAQSGHPGGSLGCAEFFVALYFNLLQHNPNKFSMDGKNEDIFILSNGHISPVWYSVL